MVGFGFRWRYYVGFRVDGFCLNFVIVVFLKRFALLSLWKSIEMDNYDFHVRAALRLIC